MAQHADVMRVLIASDIHLGFLEDDPIRGEDSFRAFEEVLKNAKRPLGSEKAVDFVLLGGDLFHENKPSRRTLHRCMELLRSYCLGDEAVSISIVSDQSKSFHGKFNRVNYDDENLNVGIPVFTIHGNHDDPAGGAPTLSAIDLLSVSGLVNYFGKVDTPDDFTVSPILLEKGLARMALYGIGNVRDERLYQTFTNRKVQWMTPAPVPGENPWFNVLVLHQNRTAHNPKAHVHDEFIEEFVDLVMWGHEHECKITPEKYDKWYVSQPGSTVATSLCEAETKQKHCALLEVRGLPPAEDGKPREAQFRVRPIELRTVRPFIWADAELLEQRLHDTLHITKEDPEYEERVAEFCAREVEKHLASADDNFATDADRRPLFRLRVNHDGLPPIHAARFGRRFIDRVANPADILLWSKRKIPGAGGGAARKARTVDLKSTSDADAVRSIEDGIEQQLRGHALPVLTEDRLHEALREFVQKDQKKAFTEVVAKQITATKRRLQRKLGSPLGSDGTTLRHLSAKELENLISDLHVDDGPRRTTRTKKEDEDDDYADHASVSTLSSRRQNAVKPEPIEIDEARSSRAAHCRKRATQATNTEPQEIATISFDVKVSSSEDERPAPAQKRRRTGRSAAAVEDLVDLLDSD